MQLPELSGSWDFGGAGGSAARAMQQPNHASAASWAARNLCCMTSPLVELASLLENDVLREWELAAAAREHLLSFAAQDEEQELPHRRIERGPGFAIDVHERDARERVIVRAHVRRGGLEVRSAFLRGKR